MFPPSDTEKPRTLAPADEGVGQAVPESVSETSEIPSATLGEPTSSESLEPVQAAVAQTRPLEPLTHEASSPQVSARDLVAASFQMPRSRHSMLVHAGVITASVVVAIGFFGVITHYVGKQNAAKSAASQAAQSVAPTGLPINDNTLTLRGKLNVADETTLNGDVTIKGKTTLQGMTVNGDATFAGAGTFASLKVGGTVVAANLQGNVSGSFTGTATGTFTGVFSGDGSKLTNIPAASCADCVRLQTGTSNPQSGTVALLGTASITGTLTTNGSFNLNGNQTIAGNFSLNGDGSFSGNISISKDITAAGALNLTGNSTIGGSQTVAGNVTSAGALVGQKLHIKPSVDDTDVVNVQDASGTELLNIDTTHRQIRTADLLPEAPGSISVGSVTPGINKTTIVADTGGAYDDNDKWAVRGLDGYMRLVYIDENTSAITYVRCKDKNCSDKVVASVAQDYENWTDSASIALDNQGNAYISYVDWTSTSDIRVVHCLDADCTQTTDNVAGQYAGYNDAISVGGDNLPNIVYDTSQYDSNTGSYLAGLDYVHCLTPDCSSTTTQALVPAQLRYQDSQQWYFYYETQAMATDKDGYERIAYIHENEETGYTNETKKLEYVRCTSFDCSSRTQKELGDADYYTSIAVDGDGFARVVFSTTDNFGSSSSLKYGICSDADCSTFTIKTLDVGPTGNAPQGDIVLSPEGYPRISAYQMQPAANWPYPYHLKYYSCADVACNSYTTTTIDTDIGYSNSLIIGFDGLPQIVYFDKSSTALRLASLVTPDGSDILVQSSIDPAATSIGTSTERFGQIYAQGLSLQTASPNAALIIDQQGILGLGTGPVAQFQINGLTHVAIDNAGTLQLQAVAGQTADLQLWKDQSGVVRSGVDANGNIYVGSSANGELAIGTGSDGSLLRVLDSSQKQVVTLDPQGALTLGALESNTYIKTDYALATGAQPQAIQVADLNHDGRPDIVTANGTYVPTGWGVTVLINNGNGFTSTLYPTSPYNPSIVLADFNGDGNIDIAVANAYYNYMSVMLNNGDGTFGSAVTYSAGVGASNVSQIATADFNGDGNVDIVTNNAGSGTLSVMLNNGSGVFSLSTTATATAGGISLATLGGVVADDFNGDGKPDFVTISLSQGGIYTFINNGDGTFTQQDGGDFGYWTSINKAGDLNGDGKPDIVLGSGGANDCIATGNGDGTFSYGSCLNAANTPSGITVVDLNNDGLADVANVDSFGVLSAFYAKSDHTFSDRIDIPIKSQATYGLAASDFNGDGQTDFAVGGVDGNLSIYSAPSKLRPSLVVAPVVGRQGIVLQSNAGQTADLLDVIDTVGHTSLSIAADGTLSTDGLTVIKDTDIKNNLSVGNTLEVGNIANVYGHDYSISGGTYAPATLDAGATTLTLTDDSVSSPITLPFSVSYFGDTYTGLSVGSDGYVSFVGGGIKGCRGDITTLKQSCAGSIVAVGTDLNPSTGGTVKYETFGTAPNRTFVVDFNNVAEFGNPGHATFQIQILENDGSQAANIIKIENGSISLTGHTFAQGLISADGSRVVYEPSHNNISNLASEEITYAYTPQYSAYSAANSIAVEKQLFVGGDVQVQGSVSSNKTVTSTISAQPALQFTDGSVTTGLNVSWYNATSGNYSTIGAGTLAYQGVASAMQPFYAYCIPGFCMDPYWPTGVNTTYVNSRWTGWIKTDASDNYTFTLNSDDHAALYINNVLLVDATTGACCQQKQGTIYLAGNAWYPIEYDYSQGGGNADSFVYWSNTTSTTPVSIPFDHVSATLPGGYVASQGTLQLQSATAITNQSAALVGLLIKASSGQTADLLQLQTSSGSVVAKVDANGALTLAPTYQPASVATNGTNASNVLTVTGSKGGNTTGTTGQVGGVGAAISLTAGAGGNAVAGSTNGNGGSITLQGGSPGTGGAGGSYGNVLLQPNGTGNVGLGTNAPGAKLQITIDSASKIGQIIRAASGQTADLLQAQDLNAAVLVKLDANGNNTSFGTNQTISNLAVPVFGANTSATTGGTLTTPNTYFYVITATNAQGQTVASTNASFAPTTTTSTYTLNWTKVNGATGYKIYRNTSNSFTAGSLLLTTISNGSTITYTDTGSTTIAGLPPTAPTGTGLIIKAWQAQTGALLQAQDSTGAVLASISSTGNLSVKSGTFSGTVTINGHIISGNTSGSTTAAAGAGAGASATCTISGNDTAGKVTIGTGASGVAAGTLCTITFSSAYGSAPFIILTANNGAATTLQYYYGSATGNFTINTNNAPAISTGYIYSYWISQ